MRSIGKTVFARGLRKNATEAEKLLWRHLRRKQLEGLKFRRQQPIAGCIVDFVCLEKNIIIEIDGGEHAAQAENDYRRDIALLRIGYRVIRFWNNEVLGNIEGVLEKIRSSI